jgi:drug/metabolite transporter (DMT)-like permease
VAIAMLAAALFGAAAPLGKWLLGTLSPLQLAGLLYLGAALAVAPLLRRGPRRLLPQGARGRLRLAGAVVCGGLLGPVLLLLGLRVASAASVSLWLNLELAATALLGAALFRDRLGAPGAAGVALAAAAGVLLALGEGAAGAAAGALVAAACLCWALDNHWTALLDDVPAAATTFWKGAVAGSANLALGAALAPLEAEPALLVAALAGGALCYASNASTRASPAAAACLRRFVIAMNHAASFVSGATGTAHPFSIDARDSARDSSHGSPV